MSSSGSKSKRSARSPSPAGSDTSDVVVFTGRLQRASQRPKSSDDHSLAPEKHASSNSLSPWLSLLPDPKHAGVTEGSSAPRRAQKHEHAPTVECHELENNPHSIPQVSRNRLEYPPSHGNAIESHSEAVVAVHRYDGTPPTYNPNYGPKCNIDDDGCQPMMPECVATSPRYKPSYVRKYDMVKDTYRPMTPEYVATSPRYKPEHGLEYDPSYEPRYDRNDDQYHSTAPKYIPVTPEYSLTSSLNSTTSKVSTSSPNASHEENEDNDKIEATRQEEAEKLEEYEIAINSLAEREKELQRASEACDRASHRFLKHGLDEDECDRTHAEWARLRTNYGDPRAV
ncbi:hypothetical protein LTS10_012070 [Elasticomyces elasticus]|nr:hypothetical protein LTS10_012070 [Elasticomyces elasticus]